MPKDIAPKIFKFCQRKKGTVANSRCHSLHWAHYPICATLGAHPKCSSQ
jgi:hypothetical protein